MPHISRQKVSPEARKKLEGHLFNLLMNTSGKGRQRIFNELYTATERTMFAKRIGMLVMLEHGLTTYTISKILGVSSSTVFRFQAVVARGGYKETRQRLMHIDNNNRFIKFLTDLGTIPFGPRPKSLVHLIDEL
jgi:uncharacterized protein YerC